MDATCSKCASSLSVAELLYDEHGSIICEKCLLDAQSLASQSRAAGKVKAIAYSGPVLGLVAFLFNPWWLISVAAIANGLYVFRSLSDTQTAARLARVAEKMRVAAIAGMVLGGITAVIQLLRMMGKFAE
jgi:hypothetical protein